jgi:hypothetical protein
MKVKIFTGYHSQSFQEPANIVMRKIDGWSEENPECIIKDIEVVPYAIGGSGGCHIFITATIKYIGKESQKISEHDNKKT